MEQATVLAQKRETLNQRHARVDLRHAADEQLKFTLIKYINEVLWDEFSKA